METFCGVSNSVNNNFDSLFVPFRCIASDVENKQAVVFGKGDLSSSVRASMSYPFYLRPISINGKLLFDGGLYNNFPTDVMTNDFKPDFIIGSNVAEKNLPPNDDDLYLQLRNLLMTQSNINPINEKGILIEPWSDVSVFNFDNAQRLIDSGYAATIRIIPKIKNQINKQILATELNTKRTSFKNYQKLDSITYNKLEIVGYNKSQSKFI